MSVMKQKLTIEVEYDSSRWTSPDIWFDTLNNKSFREIAGSRSFPTFVITDYDEPFLSKADLTVGKWYKQNGYVPFLYIGNNKIVHYLTHVGMMESPSEFQTSRGVPVEVESPVNA